MFERFTHEARDAVVAAQDVARHLGAPRISPAHVLVGAARVPGSVAGRALASLGIAVDDVAATVATSPADGLDADALASVGIDLEAVRDQAERTFGAGAFDAAARPVGAPRGHIPFDPQAKKLLELALREAVRLRQNRIDSGHLLLAALRLEGSDANRVLTVVGVEAGAVRGAVVAAWAEAPAA
jgi:ATP-dependent Clp protease ATP-binding subunit ClpA